MSKSSKSLFKQTLLNDNGQNIQLNKGHFV